MPESTRHNKSEPVVAGRRSLAYGTRTLDPAITLVDRAREIELADESIQSHVGGKLELIAKQMRALKAEAQRILDQAKLDQELHRVACAFEKRVGQSLYLYERPDGGLYFSLLSPDDWGGSPPHPMLGAYTLEADRSFRPIEATDGQPQEAKSERAHSR